MQCSTNWDRYVLDTYTGVLVLLTDTLIVFCQATSDQNAIGLAACFSFIAVVTENVLSTTQSIHWQPGSESLYWLEWTFDLEPHVDAHFMCKQETPLLLLVFKCWIENAVLQSNTAVTLKQIVESNHHVAGLQHSSKAPCSAIFNSFRASRKCNEIVCRHGASWKESPFKKV